MTRPATCRLCRIYRHGEPPNPAPQPHACRACRDTYDKILHRLAGLAEQLDDALTPTRRQGPKVTGSRSAPTPLRLDVLAAIGPAPTSNTEADSDTDPEDTPPLHTLLTPWIHELAAWRRDNPPSPDLPARAWWLWTIATWTIDNHPDIADLARTIRTILRRVEDLTGATPKRTPIGTCTCRHPLTASVWDIRIACPGCGATWPRSKWRDLAKPGQPLTAAA